MIFDRDLEHPGITKVLQDGTGADIGIKCSVCGQAIGHEHYGECDGKIICTDCLETEWQELTGTEKLDKLGYNVRSAS